MSKAKLRQLLIIPAVQTFIQEGDFAFYQSLVQILIPEVLRPIPPSLTQVPIICIYLPFLCVHI